MQNSNIKHTFTRRSFYIFTFFLIISIFSINSMHIFHINYIFYDKSSFDNDNLETNLGIFGTLSLTNPSEINGSVFTLNSTISIKGRFYNKIPPTSGYPDFEIELVVNNVPNSIYSDITDSNGDFQIDYIIDPNLDIYSLHNISVIVTNSTPLPIENTDFYMIDVNITSYFDVTSHDDLTIPKLTEEVFAVTGNLRYSNGTGIPNRRVNFTWISGITTISEGYFTTDSFGALDNVQVPITTVSQLTLKLDFIEPLAIDYSEYFIYNIKVFSDISWDLDIDYSIIEGESYTLTGTLYSSTDSSLRINSREIEILYNRTRINTTPDVINTSSDGSFLASFQIPEGNGTASLQVRLINFAGKNISSNSQNILVEQLPATPSRTGGLPPFLLFSVIFFPILAAVIIGLVVYGIFYYRKQEEVSRVVNLPLESRIRNLKILKDSGRLEESISYLFNAIYMDLIDAKYSRRRKVNETIRDFAIISVKELKLTPTSIYPFIQKVEEIIYAKPFKITDQDFYGTCELFSPIYFQLTGYNFILNF